MSSPYSSSRHSRADGRIPDLTFVEIEESVINGPLESVEKWNESSERERGLQG